MTGRKHIFLSYSSQEGDFALKLAVDLKNAGVNLWMDRLDINPGDDWRKSLTDGIDSSVAVLAVLSSAFVRSQYCQRELGRADRMGHPIVPILLTPLADEEWPFEIERQQFIDFTHWQEELHYHQQLVKLVSYLKEQFSTHIDEPPNLEARYLTSLIAALKARNSVNALVESDVRPQPFSTFEWNLNTEKTARRRTGTFFVPNILHQRRTSIINQILKSFEGVPLLVLLGEAGTGKTSLLEYLCLKFAYARQINPTTEPLPVLIRLSEWQDDTDFVSFVAQSLPFEIDLAKTVVLLDGLDEISPDQPQKIEQIRKWLRRRYKTIVTCRTQEFETAYALDDVLTVTAYNLQLRQVRAFLTSIFSAQRANQLLDELPGKHLRSIIRNPRILNLLTNIQYKIPLENIGGALHRLVQELYDCEQAKGVYRDVQWSALERTLALLAAQSHESVPYAKALEIAGARSVLAFASRAGFLVIDDDTVRFSFPTLRSYFAAVWVNQNNAALESIKDRSDFAVIVPCLVGIAADPDDFVERIAQDYPELTLQCLIADVSPVLAKSIVSDYLRTNRLPDIATLPHLELLLDTLTGILQDAPWDIRMTAHRVLQTLDLPLLPGVVEALYQDHGRRDEAAVAIKQIGTRALPTLVQHLQHEDVRLRCSAVWAMGELASRAGVPGLVLALQDEDPHVVSGAIQALSYIHDPASFPALVTMLTHADQKVRDDAFEALQWARESALDAIIAGLDHDDLAIRMAALDLLGESMQDRATEALLRATRDANPDIQLGAVAALEGRESAETIERLAECLHDKRLREVAVVVLKSYRSAAARNALENAHKPGKQTSAQEAKGRLQDAVRANRPQETPAPPESPHVEILNSLLNRIRHSDWGEREEGIKALRDYARTLRGEAAPHILKQLRALAKESDWVLRWASIEALTWIGHSSSVQDIIALLEDPYWMVRVAAIRGLVEIHDPSAADAIQARLDDTNSVVREAALEALGYLGTEQVIPRVAAVLDDPDEMLRLAAVQSLALLGKPGITGPLRKALHDADKHVRWAAAHALRDIADADAVADMIQRLGDEEKPHWEEERICDIAAQILARIGTDQALNALAAWKKGQSAADI